MNNPVPPRKPETTLQKETRIFHEQLNRLFNCWLNKIFDLTDKGSQRRSLVLMVVFLSLGFLISLRSYPLSAWAEEFSHLLQYMFNPVYAQTAPNTPSVFVAFVLRTFSSPHTFHYLPVLALPFLIALQAAATYLADIFELKQTSIAREFILQVALTGNRQHIRISGGEIAEEHKDSPIYLIGGPGKVLVELDSVALFEKPNGQPHVIGPTVKEKVTLEGFERFRQALDLRDQYTDRLEVKSRSLDGIPVSATDVRLVFSIWREGKAPTAESPHPFNEEAVKTLVYKQSSKVITEGPYPSEVPVSWTSAIQGLIRGELGRFMSKHRLTEYLASIGLPEVQLAIQREKEIVAIGKTVVSEDDTLKPRKVAHPPDFKPRRIVSSLFNQFAKGFTKKASQRGLELHWIGVGTWKSPSEIIPNKHLEAWNLSQENLARGSQGAMSSIRQESHIQQTLRLIQNVPLARFQQNRAKDHRDTTRDLLIGYREQLIETIELLSNSRRPVPPSLPAAIKHIETLLGIKHWVGAASTFSKTGAPGVGVSPPASRSRSSRSPISTTTGIPSTPPVSHEEQDLYQDLLQKTGQDNEQVERLVEFERKHAPHADRLELLQRAIDRWLRDNH